MKIQVKNFGPIKEGAVDLNKRVTVFVGHNNSGKTYMSHLLWGLGGNDLRLFGSDSRIIPHHADESDTFEITEQIVTELLQEFGNRLNSLYLPEWLNVRNDFFKSEFKFSEHIYEKIIAQSYRLIAVPTYVGKLYDSFILFEKAIGSHTVTKKHYDIPEHIARTTNNTIEFIRSVIDKETPISIGRIPDDISKFLVVADDITISTLFGNLNRFFLPASRNFVPQFYKYIYSVAKDELELLGRQSSTQEKVTSHLSPYTKPVNELIEKVYGLNLDYKPVDYYQDLVDKLDVIIGGKIVPKSAAGIAPIEFYLRLPDGKEMNLHVSSSSVNQLTTLHLYLQHWVSERDNFLIIDEPEENLHPEAQIKLVNLLMEFADRNNNRILITTHSQLLAEHINNYVNLAYLEDASVPTTDIINKTQKDGDAHILLLNTLKHSDFGVYYFDKGGIIEYTVGDYGVYFQDFQKAEDKVNETSNLLKGNIYDYINDRARKSIHNK